MQYYSRTEDYVDVELYEKRLNSTGHIFMDLIGLGIFSQYKRCDAFTLKRLCVRYMNLRSSSGYHDLGRNSVIHYLTHTEGIPENKLKKKGVKGVSLDKKKVLEPLLDQGYAKDFLTLYMAYSEADAASSNTLTVFERNCGATKVAGWDDEMLFEIPFKAKPQLNLRFNYSNEDIIGFPKEVKSLVQAPENYVLVWGDFAQSDARIAYNTLLKDESNIKYINMFPNDIYAGFAKWVSEFTKSELKDKLDRSRAQFLEYKEDNPNLKESDDYSIQQYEKELRNFVPFTGFKSARERDNYKVYCLQTIYGTRNHPVKPVSNFIAQFAKVLHSCERYDKYYKDVTYRASLGHPLRVQCYMGHVEQVPAFDGKQLSKTLFKCLNYPVQGGSSEIVILTVNKILDKFYSLGYSETDIKVYYVRHDEPIFIMKRGMMRDSWVFKDFEQINVEGWIPLELKFEFGHRYSQADRDLNEKYSLACRVNSNKIQKIEYSSVDNSHYYPLNNMLILGAGIASLCDGRKIVCFYSDNKADFRILGSDVSDEAILPALCERYASNIKDSGNSVVVVENGYIERDVFDENNKMILFKYRQNSENFSKARVLALVAAAKIDDSWDDYTRLNAEFLESIEPLGIFGRRVDVEDTVQGA